MLSDQQQRNLIKRDISEIKFDIKFVKKVTSAAGPSVVLNIFILKYFYSKTSLGWTKMKILIKITDELKT